MTSGLKSAEGVRLFVNLKAEKWLSLFSGDLERAFSTTSELDFNGIEISLSELEDLASKYGVGFSAVAI